MSSRKHRWILIIILIVLFPAVVYAWLYVQGYSIRPAQELAAVQAKKAIAAGDITLCTRVLPYPELMGRGTYDIINGCFNEYIRQTGEIQYCKMTLGAGSCVTRFAKERNDPQLCENAYFEGKQDDRGSCFGYFAERERDYHYCEQLLSLSEVPESQNRICISNYIGRDKSKINLSLCESISTPDLKEFCIARVRNSL